MKHRSIRLAALIAVVLVSAGVSACESNAAKRTTGTTPAPKSSAMVSRHHAHDVLSSASPTSLRTA